MHQKRVLEGIHVLDEFAFICTDAGARWIELISSPLTNPDEVDDIVETFWIKHFDPKFAVKISKGAAGLIHIYNGTYNDGSKDIIVTNTVFPNGKYRTDCGASSIAFAARTARAHVGDESTNLQS